MSSTVRLETSSFCQPSILTATFRALTDRTCVQVAWGTQCCRAQQSFAGNEPDVQGVEKYRYGFIR